MNYPCGYHPEIIRQALQAVYPQIMTKIRFERSPKPSKAEKEAQGKSGFVPVATRWLVERSNSWIERCKSLVKNEEVDSRPCKGKTQSLLYQANAQAISYSLKRY